jgi:hypothetical protein
VRLRELLAERDAQIAALLEQMAALQSQVADLAARVKSQRGARKYRRALIKDYTAIRAARWSSSWTSSAATSACSDPACRRP